MTIVMPSNPYMEHQNPQQETQQNGQHGEKYNAQQRVVQQNVHHGKQQGGQAYPFMPYGMQQSIQVYSYMQQNNQYHPNIPYIH
eukprot:jgi/Orpsp1_1/1187229/evm.model.d7180000056213.1